MAVEIEKEKAMKILFEEKEPITKDEVEKALDFCLSQVVGNLPVFTHKFQNEIGRASCRERV